MQKLKIIQFILLWSYVYLTIIICILNYDILNRKKCRIYIYITCCMLFVAFFLPSPSLFLTMLSSRLVSLLLVTIAASVSAAPMTKLKGVPGPMVEVHGSK